MLGFIWVLLGAEFGAESNGVIYEEGYRSKIGTLLENTVFSKNLKKVISARIHYLSCVGSEYNCAEFRIKFRIY